VPGFFSSGRFVCERARVGSRLLVQDPQAVPCEELRLGDLAILSRPKVARGERIGGGPVHSAGSPSLNAWPARPRHARSRHILCSTSFRALRSVLNSDVVRAVFRLPHAPAQVALSIRSKLALKSRSAPRFINVEKVAAERRAVEPIQPVVIHTPPPRTAGGVVRSDLPNTRQRGYDPIYAA